MTQGREPTRLPGKLAIPAAPRSAPGAETTPSAAARVPLPREIAFLENRLADRATLVHAAHLAGFWETSAEQVLFALGLVDPDDYYRLLAAQSGLAFTGLDHHHPRPDLFTRIYRRLRAARDVFPLTVTGDGLRVAYAPRGAAAGRLAELTGSGMPGYELQRRINLTTPQAIRDTVMAIEERAFLNAAVHGLASRFPEMSAQRRLSVGQYVWLALAGLVLAVSFTLAPQATLLAANLVLALFFLSVTGLRVAAAMSALGGGTELSPPNLARQCDSALPRYTLLVPLYKEAPVLKRLARALRALDYPPHLLDIKLILEGDDEETIAAAQALDLPDQFRLVLVPPCEPRTKPKALNFALQTAEGEYVAIFDAEDRPEPDQLKKAVAAFAACPPTVACLQAKLSFYNVRQSWLTRQFTIEYAALFDILLPALQRLGLPLPLGGTSNHFRKEALLDVGAWDPFNVTEDADLGMRLWRRGYRARVLASTTYEEACGRFGPWLKQRTRWLKGWMQTFAVHTREPIKAAREMGVWAYLGLLVLMGGIVVSALAHPLFAAGLIYGGLSAALFGTLPSLWSELYLGINLWNLITGYGAAIVIGWWGLRYRGLSGLYRDLAMLPIYWLAVSLGAYRAAWHFIRRPWHWEKTEHGLDRATAGRIEA